VSGSVLCWGMLFVSQNMGIYLKMSSGVDSGLEWAGSVRGVTVIVAVVRWGHGSVLCCCLLCWGVLCQGVCWDVGRFSPLK